MPENGCLSDAGTRPDTHQERTAFGEIERALRYLIEHSDGYGRVELVVHAGEIREVEVHKRVKIAV